MATEKQDPLEKRLNAWKVSIEGDSDLASHVLTRIATERPPAFTSRIPKTFRWAVGIAAAAVVVVSVFLVSQQLERKRIVREGSYLLMIDPVSRVQVESEQEASFADDSLIDRLAWMQERLNLSQEQFLALVDLHTSYSGRFDNLYGELIRLDGQFAEFEDLRKQDQIIDFIALYKVLKDRREAEENSSALSREFIAKVTSLLGPDQRASYLSLVQRHPFHSND